MKRPLERVTVEWGEYVKLQILPNRMSWRGKCWWRNIGFCYNKEFIDQMDKYFVAEAIFWFQSSSWRSVIACYTQMHRDSQICVLHQNTDRHLVPDTLCIIKMHSLSVTCRHYTWYVWPSCCPNKMQRILEIGVSSYFYRCTNQEASLCWSH